MSLPLDNLFRFDNHKVSFDSKKNSKILFYLREEKIKKRGERDSSNYCFRWAFAVGGDELYDRFGIII